MSEFGMLTQAINRNTATQLLLNQKEYYKVSELQKRFALTRGGVIKACERYGVTVDCKDRVHIEEVITLSDKLKDEHFGLIEHVAQESK